mmetsp:Transcript_11579/g.27708  ORF Transcript_11579/g.27708 Transcript_11579/m.27708 type:complete len:782 (-) Transcript_11579:55-2400(-)
MASEAAEVKVDNMTDELNTLTVNDGGGAPPQSNDNSSNKKKSGGNKKPAPTPPREWTGDLQADYDRIMTVGEECISPTELKALITAKGRDSGNAAGINLYDGFEPSGRMHIAQGVFKAMNVNKCTYPGTNSTFIFWVADWFALMNDKMGGDLDKIQTVGKYLIEVWKAAGMDLSNVVFKWCSDEITEKADEYWPKMLDIARRFNITRIKKCCQIMGRLEGSLTSAQILYPLMQCTDVFFLKADICQLGVDQRKVNMLAREYCDAAKIKNKPIILSHHMLYGLKAGQEKMSKSDPDSAVFMEDSAEDVERKILNAYCPSKEKESAATPSAPAVDDAGKESMHLTEDKIKNPCLDYIHHIIFSPPGATFTAGGTTYTDFASVRDKFLSGEMSETELKQGLIDALNKLLEPVRTHFSSDETARDLLAKVREYKKEALPKDTKVRRLNLVELSKVPAGSHLVFAPVPTPTPTLQEAFDVLAMLRQAPEGRSCVLMLLDWSARVVNACDADIKGIAAYYTILLTSLRALDSVTMDKVQTLYQSEAILSDPSNYWISVINAGRHFMLNDVMGPDMADSEGVGSVISRLMKVADVAGVEPASVGLLDRPNDQSSGAIESKLIAEFFREKLPNLTQPVVSTGSAPTILLQEREKEAFKTENDEYYLLDDPKVNGKSKMKKAFCEPKNTTFCPPIAVASVLAFGLDTDSRGEFTVGRSAENGGDVTFKNRAELEGNFGDESLHPGDLKAATTKLIVATLEDLSGSIKKDNDSNKAAKALKALQKKMAKKK